MTIYLILILVFLPGQQEPAEVIRREVISASSASKCQERADAHARDYINTNVAALRRLNATVAGRCVKQGETT